MPAFMHKLNKGYSRYFNIKYERKGTLFEGPYKAVRVEREAHFNHLPYYIHLNPLDLKYPTWRDRKLKDYKLAFAFLNTYRWSSHLDYLGKKNFPSVTQREFIQEYLGKGKEYEKEIQKWLKSIQTAASVRNSTLNE